MPVASPHCSSTFTIAPKGTQVVEQDSEGDLLARAKNVAVCPQGYREDNPDFGIPPLLFQSVPLDIASVQADIARWAELDLTVSEHMQGLETAVRTVLAEVSKP